MNSENEKVLKIKAKKIKKARVKRLNHGNDLLEAGIQNDAYGSLEVKKEFKKNSEPMAEKTETEAMAYENSYMQWSVGENGKYIPCFKTISKVPPGIYELRMSNSIGFYIEKQNNISDDLLNLPIDEIQEILVDIDKFWKRASVYKSYGYTHKRGILLYGPPGNGKSYLIQMLSQYLIEKQKGVVLNLKDYHNVDLYLEYAGPIFRVIEPGTPIIVMLEDIDNIVEYDRSTLTKVLNMLDGIKQIDKVVYIATTNYPEKLQARIANRPSRFDRRYEIKTPSSKVREFYIKNKMNEKDLKKINLSEWVKKTEGLSISHLKELILSVVIYDTPFKDALALMKNMSKKITGNGELKSIGFSNQELPQFEEEL